jgi:hypothetical protein
MLDRVLHGLNWAKENFVRRYTGKYDAGTPGIEVNFPSALPVRWLKYW